MSKHGTALSTGQFAEFAGAVIRALPRDIDPEVALGWANNGASLTRVMKDALCPPEEMLAEKPKVLKARDRISVVPHDTTFDPNKFFVTGEGLWVSDRFKLLVLKGAMIEGVGGAMSLTPFDLMHAAYDREIKNEMPQNHEVALWPIARMIEVQLGGTPGPLLNDGNWNIFYRAGLVVNVGWDANRQRWGMEAYRLDVTGWNVDSRVFSGS